MFVRTTVTLNGHYLPIKKLAQGVTVYTKIPRKYSGFHDSYIEACEDFQSALDTLLYATLAHQIIEPVLLERYLIAIAYDLTKTSPNYELVVIHLYSIYAELLNSLTHSPDQLLVQIPKLPRHVPVP